MDKIEQYIINSYSKNDPSIMELKQGCNVMLTISERAGEIGFVEFCCGKCTKHKRSISCNEDCDIQDAISVVLNHEEEPIEFILVEGDYKILGRDIYLHDVLGAIENTLQNYGEMGRSRTFIYERFLEVIREWNLKKPLHEQEEETKLLLARILGFKE